MRTQVKRLMQTPGLGFPRWRENGLLDHKEKSGFGERAGQSGYQGRASTERSRYHEKMVGRFVGGRLVRGKRLGGGSRLGGGASFTGRDFHR